MSNTPRAREDYQALLWKDSLRNVQAEFERLRDQHADIYGYVGESLNTRAGGSDVPAPWVRRTLLPGRLWREPPSSATKYRYADRKGTLILCGGIDFGPGRCPSSPVIGSDRFLELSRRMFNLLSARPRGVTWPGGDAYLVGCDCRVAWPLMLLRWAWSRLPGMAFTADRWSSAVREGRTLLVEHDPERHDHFFSEAVQMPAAAVAGCSLLMLGIGRLRDQAGNGLAAGKSTTTVSRQAQALGVLAEHPDWTDTRIADELGVNRSSLYRWPTFRKARAAAAEAGRAHRTERSEVRGHR